LKNQAYNLPEINQSEHLVRRRVNALLEKATEKPLVIVCAGAGCGKTRAVYDYIRSVKSKSLWTQLSEHDNMPSRYWEGFISTFISVISKSDMDDLRSLGFPNTADKLRLYTEIRDRYMADMPCRKYLTVIDDFHLIKNPDVLRFVEWVIKQSPEYRSFILISREFPQINIADLQNRGGVYVIQEDDLSFTENEIALYLNQQGLSIEPRVLSEIYQDTQGWAFSVDLVARLLKKAPGYIGYAQVTMKKNIFKQMDAEVWGAASDPFKHFLLRLSLIEHLPEVLVNALADDDADLLSELKRQNAHIRYDEHMSAYLIHHLFLDFLRSKQELLTDDEKKNTYQAAADWCRENGFTVDAIRYYESAGSYESIVSILEDMSLFIPHDLALFTADVFKRIPEEAFLRVEDFAIMHLRTVFCLGREQDFTTLADYYERKFLEMPQDSARSRSLGFIYALRGAMRMLMGITDEKYDFNLCFAQMDAYLQNLPIKEQPWFMMSLGSWINLCGSSSKGAMENFMNAIGHACETVTRCLGIWNGGADLVKGELKFYQGDVQGSESSLLSALEQAREAGWVEAVHRALFYLMRIAFVQGKYEKAEQTLKDIETLRAKKEFAQRFASCDIARGWYHYILRQPEQIQVWLKEKFSPYSHAYFPENFGNQMKARFHYMTKNFTPLLAYIREMKSRESILFGRVEMLAMEACARYQMRDKAEAFAALRKAYETASPNDIIMPFIELGKDMRTLVAAARREADCGIPKKWLEAIYNKAKHYAKYQTKMIDGYEIKSGTGSWTALSSRETEILHDLCAGLSRAEIAKKQGLALSTVHMNVRNVFIKLNADNVSDVIRIATERKLV